MYWIPLRLSPDPVTWVPYFLLTIAPSAILHALDLDSGSVATEAALVGPVLDRSDVELTNFGFSYLNAIVQNTKPTERKISLFNKCQQQMTEDEVRQVLAELPTHPGSWIA
ncbi:MAG: hypothetical protein ABJM82_15440 [Shimia thalassica]|uniref:hypothetical protein n=1 Tax=Shimia thalassica TaxID=1715693 RepID=UPI003296F09B